MILLTLNSTFILLKIFVYCLIFLPLLAFFFVIFIPSYKIKLLNYYSILFSFFIFLFSLFLLLYFFFNSYYTNFNSWFFLKLNLYFNYLNINYILGIDGISLILIILTTFLIFICVLTNIFNVYFRLKEFTIILFFLEFFLLNSFLTLNFFYFFIFFEIILLPMFLIIGIWGSRQRKIHALIQFFLYTLFGSIFMLFSILLIYINIGSLYLEILYYSNFNFFLEKVLWVLIFISFSIKIPILPLHIWLPEAHVEAPTSGSILLAGILLKLGVYGIFRFLITIFFKATIFFLPLINLFLILSVLYCSFSTLRQIDLKKVIAYSSVVHMNYSLLGIFTYTIEGIQGCIYTTLTHGITSAALFFLIGVLYNRYGTRLIKYYSNLIEIIPNFSIFLFIFILANLSFPLTGNFISEILVFFSIFKKNFFIGIISSLGLVISSIYSIWLYNKIIFKDYSNFLINKSLYLNSFNYFYLNYNNKFYIFNNKIKNNYILLHFFINNYISKKNYYVYVIKYKDLTFYEFYILLVLFLIILVLGIYPNFFLNLILYNSLNLVIFI